MHRDFAPSADDGDEYIDDRHAITKLWAEGEWVGIQEHHLREDGLWCSGAVMFKRPGVESERSTWTVLLWEPLTLSPSILCNSCPEHGYIEGGKWRKA